MIEATRVNRRAALLAAILMAAGGRCWGYAEDIGKDTEQGHSTFHYELTRALARAAGYGAGDAETIGISAAATDTGTFKGDLESSPRITIEGTQRISESGQYYHFGRRHGTNATGEYAYPGGRDECPYYTERHLCPVPAEIDEIEYWAVYGQGTPTFGVPQYSVDGGPTAPVESKSLVALGIYLHALADSYSHERCMEVAQVRLHLPEPKECTGVFWHEEAEFGVRGDTSGVPYTKEAGRAMWIAVRWFRQQTGMPDAPLMTDGDVEAFIDQWAELDSAEDRRELAAARFEALDATPTPTETATPKPSDTPTEVPTATAAPKRTATSTSRPTIIVLLPSATPMPGGGGGCSLGQGRASGAGGWIFAALAAVALLRGKRAPGSVSRRG